MPDRNFSTNLQSILPADVGLASWAQIPQLPGVNPGNQQALVDRIARLDELKRTGSPIYQQELEALKQMVRQNSQPQLVAPPPTDPGLPGLGTPQAQPAPAPAAPPPAAVAPPPTLDTAPIDIDALVQSSLDTLLASISQGSSLQSLEGTLAPTPTSEYTGELLPNEQRILDLTLQGIEGRAETARRGVEKRASGVGLRKSTTLEKGLIQVEEGAARAGAEAEVAVRTEAGRQATAREAEINRSQESRFQLNMALKKSIDSGNAQLAATLLGHINAEAERELTREQFELQREFQQANITLARDQFSADQIDRMEQAGFTDRQISLAEDQAKWERGFQEQRATASEDLARSNLDLQRTVANRELDQGDRQLAMAEIKNNSDIGIQDRLTTLQETLGLKGADLDERNFQHLVETVKREYDLDVNEFALREWLATEEVGLRKDELAFQILDSTRKFDLSVKDQADQFFLSQQSLDLQKLLGLAELDLRKVIAGEEIDLRREGLALEKWMFQQNMSWDREVFYKKLEEERKKKKGGLLGGIIKAVAGAGVGFLMGGPAGAVMGGLGAILPPGAAQDIASIAGGLAGGTPGPINPDAMVSELGDWVVPTGTNT